jgi:hypothetical protein
LTTEDDSRIIALVRQAPPGRLERRADEMVARDEEGSAKFRLDALAQAAKEAGIRVRRSQIRRIYLREGVRWRHTHSWGDSHDPDFVPKEQRSSATTRSRPKGRRLSAPTNSVKSIPRTFAPASGWSADGHRIRAPLDDSRGPQKVWVDGADAASAMGR